jgi:tetratricopeptide (TPR) repeat protein
MAGTRTVRLFVSSPSDVEAERQRVEVVAERLNGLYAGIVRIETIRWETKFYTADKSFQPQIPEAAECDIVIGIFWARLGSELPPTFPKMPDGTPYPSGTGYEILSAIQKRMKLEAAGRARPASGEAHTDVYIFQKSAPPFPAPKDERDLALLDTQWKLLKTFFERWFRTHEGHFLAAFHGFTTTDQFEEQIEKLLRNWLAEHVLGARALVWPIAIMGSPFRGLEAFDARHAPVFFGRSRDIVRATDRLKTAGRVQSRDTGYCEPEAGATDAGSAAAKPGCPFLLVVGASGAGKSSLVRAGIVPRLITPGFVREVDRWRVATVRFGHEATPFDALAQALFVRGTKSTAEGGSPHTALPELAEGDHPSPHDLAMLWRGGALTTRPIERALDRVAAAERASGKFDRTVRVNLVLVIDQLDDLFVSDLGDACRAQVAALLANLAATGRIWIIAALRAALYERYLAESAFEPVRDAGASYDLAPPGRAEIAEIVRKPAEAAGLIFEQNVNGVSLDEQLLADAADPDTLPLLQFTLQALFEERQKVGDQFHLTFAAYEMLGGIDGAINRAAENALQQLSTAEKDALPRLLRQLVVDVGSSAVASGRSAMAIRSVPLASAVATPAANKLVDALVEARILTSEGDGKAATIRVTHQRALESWVRAQEILRLNSDFYRIRSEVEVRHQHWNVRGRKSELLLPAGLPLAEAESLLDRFRDETTSELQDYVVKSGRRARLRQRLTAAAAVVFACVAIAAIFYWRQAQNGLVASTGAIAALVQGISDVVRPLAQLDTVEELVSQARASINQFGGASRNDGIRKQHARTHLLIAGISWDRGDIEQMRKDADEALALLETLVGNGDPENQLLRASSRRYIGLSYFESNHREDARRQYELGIADLNQLLGQNPQAALEWRGQRALANIYQELGDVLLFKYNRLEDALAAFDKCFELRQLLVEAGHDRPTFVHDLAWAANKHGDVQVKWGDDATALTWFTRARDGLQSLGDHLWDNLIWAYNLSLIYNNIGLIARRQGQYEEAIEAFNQAETIIRRVVDYDPKNLGRRSALSWTTFNRAEALFRWALSAKDVARLQQAKDGFARSNKDTGIDAAQALLMARVQLGFVRGRAYLAAIDATAKDWTGNHLDAASGFVEAANFIVEQYLPHADAFPRRDYLSEGIEYLNWAGNAYVAAGKPDLGRPLLEQALDLTSRYRAILGDRVVAALQARVDDDLAKAR